MLTVINDKGNVETGFLRVARKKQLKDYRDSLLKKTEYNFETNTTFIEKEYGHLDIESREKSYANGEILVKESFSDLLGPAIPFETYYYLFKKISTKCNNLISIQILTRLLNDWYEIENLDTISDFVQLDIMKLLIGVNGTTIPITDIYNSHIGIDKLVDPERVIDLNSFRNSFPFIEYVILKEFSLNEMIELNKISHEEKFDTKLSEIIANTQVLFGESVKTLKKINKSEEKNS